MEFRKARLSEVPVYVAFAKAVQEWLRQQGLEQYVPAAHDEYLEAVKARVIAGDLYAGYFGAEPVGFFYLEAARSSWWPVDATAALYLGGIVVAPEQRGHGIGGAILEWCARQAVQGEYDCLRLDCHAGNRWLCHYYEA